MTLSITSLVTMRLLGCMDGSSDGAGDGRLRQRPGSAKGQRYPSGGKSEYVPLQFTLNEDCVCEKYQATENVML